MRCLLILIWFISALMLAACGVQDEASREYRKITISDNLDAEAKQVGTNAEYQYLIKPLAKIWRHFDQL